MREWLTVEQVSELSPFLVSVVGDDDHWCFVGSNGGLTAGRGTPDRALFAYVPQDLLFDRAGVSGPLTLLRVRRAGAAPTLWRPLDPSARGVERRLSKRLDGTQLRFEETSSAAGLRFSYTWGLSRRLGFVRRCVLTNIGDSPADIELLDGLQDLLPAAVDEAFQRRFSVLVDAYKRAERDPETGLRLIALSSIPTDRAEPSECLRCNAVWTAGLPSEVALLTARQVGAFLDGRVPTPEHDARGLRASFLDYARLALDPGESRTWFTVAGVDLSTAAAADLRALLRDRDDGARIALIEAELARTSAGLRAMVASADGLQHSRDLRRQSRHLSNVTFNIMRGGVFIDGDYMPRAAYIEHLERAHRRLVRRHADWLSTLPERIHRRALLAAAEARGDPLLERLTIEALPLTFSRRHGDPSRPWNRFSIQVRDRRGRPRLAYEGNWRDIFQNWEALLHSFPSYLGGAVARFVNASTADGYNPYRLTSEGFDWEVVEPGDPWANIGYWGDHQIIYLLRLLEAWQRFHPGQLEAMLGRPIFTYARVPYRIAPYPELVAHPRETITYDHQAAAAIARRVAALGEDGKLLAGPDGEVLRVTLLEKLLVPLLAKLSNFVPQGGIWMNTQRPEWNDANNALVGFGVSVVTLAYCHRYADTLLAWWASLPGERTVPVSAEVAALLRAQTEIFSRPPSRKAGPAARRAWMDALGQPASDYRQRLYERGLSGRAEDLSMHEVRAWLGAARGALAESLRANRRPDGLFHSYNLLRFEPDGSVALERLPVMLEGQVAALSARLLSPAESLGITRALRASALYCADRNSYLLYPDRDLPGFLEKNRIEPALARRLPLVRALADDPDQSIIERDAEGHLHFGGPLRNAAELRRALAALPPAWAERVAADGEALVAHFEAIFEHRSFTGRSGSFFAYEGLGSIYWHMVSKLVLAVQEVTLSAGEAPERGALAETYHALLEGLGIHKSPAQYGAFPTDAYSHTPAHAGAQQPGMTGQVKEDILIRWGELGVSVCAGRLRFRPSLLRRGELLEVPETFESLSPEGSSVSTDVPAGGLAFTVCQVPVIYAFSPAAAPALTVELGGGEHTVEGSELTAELSRAIFERSSEVIRIRASLPDRWLLP